MDMRAYQLKAQKTDQVPSPARTPEGDASLVVPLLGLAGETGELLTEYKKRLRDGEAHRMFKDRVSEELGDLLWYVANVASKFDLDLNAIAEELSSLTVMQAAELVKMLEQKWGVSAAAPVAVAAGPAAGGAAGAAAKPAEEKTEFTLVLVAAGEKKINVIKEVRALTSLGLKEAKDLVEAAPKPVLEHVNKEQADKAKAQLESVGATVEVK